MWFLTTLSNIVSWIVLENDIFIKRTTKSQTPDQGQAPSRSDKYRSCYWRWDQKLGTKDAIFKASLPDILTGYSADSN